MEKIVENGILYDFYGSMLTGHQQNIYEDAVYSDMSLTEIAQKENVSRQAVSDLLKRTTAQLEKYEEQLGLVGRFNSISKNCDRIISEAIKLQEKDPDLKESIETITKAAQNIKKEL